jgi:DNA primase
MTKTNWIVIAELKKQLDFSEVLRHYGVELKLKGDQHHGFCPLPLHKGKKNSASFSANVKRGIWQCFGCGQHGNLLDFAILMENGSPKNGKDVQRIAAKLRNQFVRDFGIPLEEAERLADEISPVSQEEDVLTNVPLDFELKDLAAKHPYLFSRGFTAETIESFGLGYCRRGLLRDRIAIPIHDENGQLVAYAGRVVDDNQISEENPKYKFPGKRERDEVTYEFSKSLLLYNVHRIKAPVDDLAVVEGFTSVWWLSQAGIFNVVGTMGASCSFAQGRQITSLISPQGRLWIFTDGDEAGERCAAELFRRVAAERFVRWIRPTEGMQPTDYSAKLLLKRFPFAVLNGARDASAST